MNSTEVKLQSGMQQTDNIIDRFASISPFHAVNLNQVAVVCNVISLFATSKQTADKQTTEETSDWVAKTIQSLLLSPPSGGNESL